MKLIMSINLYSTCQIEQFQKVVLQTAYEAQKRDNLNIKNSAFDKCMIFT